MSRKDSTTGRWEEVACPVCSPDAGSEPYITCSDRLREPQLRSYQLMRCTGCGLVYLSPRLSSTAVGEFYQDEGYDPFLSLSSQRSLLEHAYSLLRSWTLKWKKRLIGRLISKDAHILDIGCSTGEFLATLAHDYRVEGVEPEPNAARWARERFGLNVHTGSVEEAPLGLDTFDLVTLWHVLEHVPSPSRELDLINRMLTSEGRLLVALPNVRSLDARMYGPYWVALDAPRHLWHFSQPQLELLARKSGFELDESGMLPLDAFYNSLYSELILKQAKGNVQFILAPIRLTFSVISSLIWGALSGQHSSKYYIFRKL